jgi:hypothetical protein
LGCHEITAAKSLLIIKVTVFERLNGRIFKRTKNYSISDLEEGRESQQQLTE